MQNLSIRDDIKQTGSVIRDWLTPFYTLGAVVTFAIGMLTLIDEDGSLHLTRIVGVILLIATAIAWVKHFYLRHKNKDNIAPKSAAAPKPHIVLLIVTGFFMVGIAASEAMMKGHRKQLQTPHVSAPAAPPTAPPNTTPEPSLAAAATTVTAQPALPTPQPTTMASSPSEATQDTASQSAKPQPQRPVITTQHSERYDALRRPEPRRAAVPSPSSPPQDPRCTALIASFSLGQDLTPTQQNYLETCR